MNSEYLEKLTVLYVEDEQDVREEIESYLSLRVKELFVANDGQAGIELFEKHQPDFIITDIQMPNLNGLEFSKYIKAQDKNIPIVVTTAFSDTSYLLDAISIGIDHYILKPVDITLFETTIKTVAKRLIQEKELIKKENLLREYKQAVDAGAMVSKTNTKGIITYANDKFCNISGYSYDELIGSNHNIVRHPDESSQTYKELWETIQSQKVWQGKVKNKNKKGEAYYVAATIIPVTDENGETIEYLALRQDVTELELLNMHLEDRVQEELAKNSQKDKEAITALTNFLNASPNPIIIFDDDKVRFANNAFLTMAQVSHDELFEHSCVLSDLFENRTDCITNIDQIDPNKDNNKVSISLKQGRGIFYILVNTIQSLDKRDLVMYTFNNITVSEYHKMKIRHYNSQLEVYIKNINKQQFQKPTTEIPSDTTVLPSSVEKEVSTTPAVAEKPEAPKELRVLDTKEREVLKRSRANVAVTSEEYSADIDEHVLLEVQELMEIEIESNDLLQDFKETYNLSDLNEIGTKLIKYTSTISQLYEFEDLSFAVQSLSNLLLNLNSEQVNDTNQVKVELYLSNIMLDLSTWRRTVFIDQSATDIHYLDSSLFSTILQFEMIFNQDQVVDDDNDLELF